MNSQQIYEVACFMRRLEEDHSIKITFESLEKVYGLVYMGRNNKYMMIININLCYEKQIETIWHESKHIYSHVMKPGDIALIEKEAVEFSKCAMEVSNEILPACRNAW
jgi:hypothetical protein